MPQKRDSTTFELKELLLTTSILGIVQEGETVSIEFDKKPKEGGASTEFFDLAHHPSANELSHSPPRGFISPAGSRLQSTRDMPAQLEEAKMAEAFLRRSMKNRDDDLAVVKAQMAAQEEQHERLVREATATITDLTALCSETQNKWQSVDTALQATKAEVMTMEAIHAAQIQTLQKAILSIRNRPLVMRQQSGMIIALDVEPQVTPLALSHIYYPPRFFLIIYYPPRSVPHI